MRALAALLLLSAAAVAQDRVDLHGDPIPPGPVARLGSVRFRHAGGVQGMVLSSSVGLLTTAGVTEGVVRTIEWDAATGRPIATRDVPVPGVCAIALSADGRVVAALLRTGEAALLEVSTGRLLSNWTAPCPSVMTLALSADGSALAVGTFTGALHFEVPSRMEAFDAAPLGTRHIGWIEIDLDTGTLLLTGGYRCPIVRADLSAMSCEALLAYDGSWAPPGALSPDGARLVTCGAPGPARLWDARTGRLLRTLPAGPGGFASAGFSRNGRVVAACRPEGDVCAWDCATGAQLLQGSSRIHPTLVALAEDGGSIAIATALNGGAIEVLGIEDGARSPSLSHEGAVKQVAFTRDGARMVSAGGEGTIRVWELESGRALDRIELRIGSTPHFALSPDGRTLAAAPADGRDWVRLWDLDTGRSCELRGRPRPRRVLGFVDEDLLCCSEPDGHAFAWDVRDLRPLNGGDLGRHTIASPFAVSPMGRRFAVSLGINGVSVRDVGGVPLSLSSSSSPRGSAFLGEDVLIVWGEYPRALRRYDLDVEYAGRSPVTILEDEGLDGQFEATRDGQLAAFLTRDRGGVRLLDLTCRDWVAEIRCGSRVTAFALSPDARTLATGGDDGCVHVWDLAPREEAAFDLDALWAELANGGGPGWAATRRLASAGDAGAKFLEGRLAPPPDVQARAADLVARLDSDDVEVREAAQEEAIEDPSSFNSVAMAEALGRVGSLEVKERVAVIQAAIAGPLCTSREVQRRTRAVRALAWMDSARAKEVLARLAALPIETPEVRLARDATSGGEIDDDPPGAEGPR